MAICAVRWGFGVEATARPLRGEGSRCRPGIAKGCTREHEVNLVICSKEQIFIWKGVFSFFFFSFKKNWLRILNWNAWFFCRQEIRTSTSSMTSVPKPLKFLRPHYGTLKTYYETMAESDLKVLLWIWCCLNAG